jgi:formate transporter
MQRDSDRRTTAADVRIDPYSPAEMAERAERVGVAKAQLSLLTLMTLGVLAGAYVAIGAHLASIAAIESTLGYGPTRLLVGVAFSIGLMLVLIAGAELFTSNTLIVMAVLDRYVTVRALLRNWSVVYVTNLIGAIATVVLLILSGQWALADHQLGASAMTSAAAKVQLSFGDALVRGILGNALVNLAVWLSLSARSTTDKILSIVPPITVVHAAGFEYVVANMYFVPMGILLKGEPDVVAASGLSGDQLADLTWTSFVIHSLLPVTIGNVVGGGVFVAGIYWLVYLRPKRRLRPAHVVHLVDDHSESP